MNTFAKPPLQFLSDTKFHEEEMISPHGLNKLRDTFRDFARNYLQQFSFDTTGKLLTDGEISEFEQRHWGTL